MFPMLRRKMGCRCWCHTERNGQRHRQECKDECPSYIVKHWDTIGVGDLLEAAAMYSRFFRAMDALHRVFELHTEHPTAEQFKEAALHALHEAVTA